MSRNEQKARILDHLPCFNLKCKLSVIEANHNNNYCAVLGLVTSTRISKVQVHWTFRSTSRLDLVDQKLCYLSRSSVPMGINISCLLANFVDWRGENDLKRRETQILDHLYVEPKN